MRRLPTPCRHASGLYKVDADLRASGFIRAGGPSFCVKLGIQSFRFQVSVRASLWGSWRLHLHHEAQHVSAMPVLPHTPKPTFEAPRTAQGDTARRKLGRCASGSEWCPGHRLIDLQPTSEQGIRTLLRVAGFRAKLFGGFRPARTSGNQDIKKCQGIDYPSSPLGAWDLALYGAAKPCRIESARSLSQTMFGIRG